MQHLIDNDKEKPIISIITITYNAEKEVGVTCASVARQSFKDFEHLVIDGASTDATVPVARRNGVAHMRIVSEPDHGLYDAMNKGLGQARGKYVIFLNAGDSFHSDDTLEAYATAAIENRADIVYGDTQLVDADRNVIGLRHLSVPERLDADSFKRGMLVCHQAFMVRRELTRDYDLRYRFSADYDWCISCINRSVPERNINLHRITINYLTDGLTDKNHIASLRERLVVMGRRYGWTQAIIRHLGFVPRAVARKLKRSDDSRNV